MQRRLDASSRFWRSFSFLFLCALAYGVESPPVRFGRADICISDIIFQKEFLSQADPIHALVQFAQPLAPGDRRELEASGVRFLHYIPENAYFISANAEKMNALRLAPSTVGAIPVPGELKLDSSLQRKAEAAKSAARNNNPPEYMNLKIVFFQDTAYKQASRTLLAHGAILEAARQGFDYHQTIDSVSLPLDEIQSLAQEDIVFLIAETDPPNVPCNLIAQDTSNIDEIQPRGGTGYNLDGSGVTAGVWDSGGVRVTHEQLRGRAVQVDGDAPNYHASHVAGTIAGGGKGNPTAEGMAPNAKLLCWNYINDLQEMQRNADKITVSNHSYKASAGWEYDPQTSLWHWYGDPEFDSSPSQLFGRYSSRTHAWDRIVYEQNLIAVLAAGNDRDGETPLPGTAYVLNQGPEISMISRPKDGGANGYNTITSLGAAKNVITVGAIYDLFREPPKPDDSSMTDYSSWGPTADGRVKPDLVANGAGLLSMSSNSDSAYESMGGTSSSAPVVAGAIACLTQLYRQRFGNADPDAAGMKCILIHTAIDGGSNAGPDYRFGWGLLDARAAADFILLHGNLGRYLDYGAYLGDPIVYEASYIGYGPITATLVWTDPPGVPATGAIGSDPPNVINDLDLLLTGPGGTYYPWTLDPSYPDQPARQNTENHRDNVEQVFIKKPAKGAYSLRIQGRVNLGDSQGYALCITGLQLTGRKPRLAILSPKADSVVDGGVSIAVQAGSGAGVSRVVMKADGAILDDPATSAKEGDVFLFPSPVETTQTAVWDSSRAANGEHVLEISATSADGASTTKNISVFVYNEPASPLSLATNASPLIGRIWPESDGDWYTIQPSVNSSYIIETHAFPDQISPDTHIALYGPYSRELLIASDDDGGIGTFSKIVRNLEKNRTYYLRVTGNQYETGFYSIDIKTNLASVEAWQLY
ncbi:MAG: S8 family serine peptidase [Candidatus Omnitrophota bacterium]